MNFCTITEEDRRGIGSILINRKFYIFRYFVMFLYVNIFSRGNYMNFKKLDIPNFHYNPDMTSEMGSIYYDSDSNEDDWYELVWDCEENDRLIIIKVRNASTVKVVTFIKDEINNIEKGLQKDTSDYKKD